MLLARLRPDRPCRSSEYFDRSCDSHLSRLPIFRQRCQGKLNLVRTQEFESHIQRSLLITGSQEFQDLGLVELTEESVTAIIRDTLPTQVATDHSRQTQVVAIYGRKSCL